jgi:hypothetical protein
MTWAAGLREINLKGDAVGGGDRANLRYVSK